MKVYAVKHIDSSVIENSRSGGIFTALSNLCLVDGVVYGCVLNEKLEAIHIKAMDTSDRDRMRGSKYVQSNMRDCFTEIKTYLDDNRKVLFSGTSCQVAGLKSFLQKDYDNLLCVDIVCHGVPSPLLLKSYLEYMGNVESIDFRNKKEFGWRDHVESLKIGDKTVNTRIWTTVFYSGNALRPSCYECKYKSISHPGDITIGDYWGIETAAPEFDDNKGVSLVLVNNSKGMKAFEAVKDALTFKETKIEDSMQRAFVRSEERPKERDKFWKLYHKKGFAGIAKEYASDPSFLNKIVVKVKNKVNRMMKNVD